MTVQVTNRRAKHEYEVNRVFEAGMCLEGWEIKAIRSGQIQIQEAYVKMLDGVPCLVGAHISPLALAARHVVMDPARTRRLLLNRTEINLLAAKVSRAGFTMVPLDIHFVKGRAKLNIGLAKGKNLHDKRAASKEADWSREQDKVLKQNQR